jgi:hypothetical protein
MRYVAMICLDEHYLISVLRLDEDKVHNACGSMYMESKRKDHWVAFFLAK